MPSLQATLRHQSIVEILQQDGNVHVAEMAERLGVSAVTVRADLDYLESQQVLRRTRGGAVPVRPRRYEMPLELTIQTNADAKKRIGRTGAEMVRSGGTLRPLQHSLVAPFASLLLREVNADIAFIGCNGVDPEKGFTNTNLDEAEVKHSMIAAARRVIFLLDHSKLMNVATARVAPLDRADVMITDDGASQDAVRRLRKAGLEVVIA